MSLRCRVWAAVSIFRLMSVLGKVDKVDFKVTGKQILKPGWRVVFGAEQKDSDAEPSDEEGVLPDFVKGESGPHKPTLG